MLLSLSGGQPGDLRTSQVFRSLQEVDTLLSLVLELHWDSIWWKEAEA